MNSMNFGTYLQTLKTDRERELQRAMLNLSQSLMGDGMDFLKPVNAQFANQIARVLYEMAWGDTYEEAVKKVMDK